MNQRRLEYVVGLFVLAGFLAIAALAVYIGGGETLRGDTRDVVARFTSVGGLNVGSRVEVAGVRVGAVQRIQLAPDASGALVTLRLSRSVKIYDDAIASVRTSGLIGAKIVHLSPGGSGMELPPGAMIVDTESPVDLESLIKRFAFGGLNGSGSPASKP